jgi:shikimate kinase
MKNIVLTGFMGSGKSAVGEQLSRMLSWRLIDVDNEIMRSRALSINEIFSRLGEPAFREIEAEMIRSVARERNVVISTGGGAVLRKENVAALRERGVIVNLVASAETIFERTGGAGDRPLLLVEDPLKRIKEMLEERRTYYEDADIVVDTEGRSPLEIAEEILVRLGWR